MARSKLKNQEVFVDVRLRWSDLLCGWAKYEEVNNKHLEDTGTNTAQIGGCV